MANKGPSSLTAASAFDGTELWHVIQSGNSRKATAAQQRAYALAAFGANGIPARTAAGTFAARTITASAGIAVTNGDGVAGAPAFALAMDGAKVRKAVALTAQNLTSITAVVWTAEDWDTGGYHSTVTNTDRLTVTNAGNYECRGQLVLNNVAAANFVLVVLNRYNSSDVIQEAVAVHHVEISATGDIYVNLSGAASFSSGDFLRMRVQVEADTSTDIATDSYLEIRRVG